MSTAVKEEKVESDDETAMEVEEDVYSPTQEGVSFDLNIGDPDMQRFWVSEEEYPEWMSCCLLYTSPSPRDRQKSRMPSSA